MSGLAVGLQWAARVTVIGCEFAGPPLAGVALDRWWGSSPLVTLAGCGLGFAVGMWHVLRFAGEGTSGGKVPPNPGPPPPPT